MQTMYQTLNTLYEHAKDNMSAEELESLSRDMLDSAVNTARDMSAFLEGAACLISSDKTAGSLQSPDSIFQMLCLSASNFDLIAGLVETGNDAKFAAKTKTKIKSKKVAA